MDKKLDQARKQLVSQRRQRGLGTRLASVMNNHLPLTRTAQVQCYLVKKIQCIKIINRLKGLRIYHLIGFKKAKLVLIKLCS